MSSPEKTQADTLAEEQNTKHARRTWEVWTEIPILAR
jgi:hypothetical protein